MFLSFIRTRSVFVLGLIFSYYWGDTFLTAVTDALWFMRFSILAVGKSNFAQPCLCEFQALFHLYFSPDLRYFLYTHLLSTTQMNTQGNTLYQKITSLSSCPRGTQPFFTWCPMSWVPFFHIFCLTHFFVIFYKNVSLTSLSLPWLEVNTSHLYFSF